MARNRHAGSVTSRSRDRWFPTQLSSRGWFVDRRCFLPATVALDGNQKTSKSADESQGSTRPDGLLFSVAQIFNLSVSLEIVADSDNFPKGYVTPTFQSANLRPIGRHSPAGKSALLWLRPQAALGCIAELRSTSCLPATSFQARLDSNVRSSVGSRQKPEPPSAYENHHQSGQ